MFSPKGLFSEITCPYSEACLTPNCLFAHPKSDPADCNTAVTIKNEGGFPVANPGSDGERHKRRKLVAGEGPNARTPVLAIASPVPKKALSSIARPISPPILRLQGDHDSKSPVRKPPSVPSPKPKTVALKPPKPVKAESLNPRLLKQAPAPHEMRYKLLKILHEHFVRLNTELTSDLSSSEENLILSDQELITMALDMEENAAKDKPSIYMNIVKNKILVYKRMTAKDWKEERAKERAQARALDLKDSSVPLRDPPKPIETGLNAEDQLTFLSRLYAPMEGLANHGYVTKVPTADDIEHAKKGIDAAKGWEVCDRCKTRFQVFPGRREEDGALTSGGPCTYHWAKPYWQDRLTGDPKAKREKKYRCCGQSVGDSPGCTQAASHVFKVTEVKRLAALLNFEETPDNSDLNKPVCIDGEMGYTVHGLELIRLTATTWPAGEEIFDVLVRPIGEILDLNSRWSGVWPEQIANAIPWEDGTSTVQPMPGANSPNEKKFRIVDSPAAARSLLFQHVSRSTPIIGHGLENDLNAVRVVHHTIIDTVLIFPHKAGLPYRNALKMLMRTHLDREIQVMIDGKAEGHDSKEDANAAGDLVRWAIGVRWAKMKRDGWRVEDGQFLAPEARQRPTGEFSKKDDGAGNNVDASIICEGANVTTRNGKKRSLADYERDEDAEEGEVMDG
jgi:RNA exonuclease 1